MPVHTEVLYLVPLFIVFLLILIGGFRRSEKTLESFFGSFRGEAVHETYIVKYFFAGLGILLALSGMILSLAGFHMKKDLEISDHKGTDIVFVMDISRSMLCEDVDPNRLQRGAGIARGIVERTAGARFGIVIFKGEAVKTIPVTEDTEAVISFLDILDPVLLSSPGSNAEEALRCAAGAFPDLEQRRRVIVLFSDGESLTGDPGEAAAVAAAEDITILTVGLGTEEGGAIPLADGEVLLNPEGRPVHTKLNGEILMQIARRTSGEYIGAADPGIINRISSLAGAGIERPVFKKKEADVYRIFLLASLGGFLVIIVVRVKRWKNLD